MPKKNPGTGTPDPTKDRSAHEAARRVKKMTLQDLAKQLPSDEHLAHYITFINLESDRGAAVMAAALVERALEDKIRSNLPGLAPETISSWFDGQNAPFRTFAGKIALGRALSLYDDTDEARLTLVKNVRNAFAHCASPLTFAHPTLTEVCKALPPSVARGENMTARRIFGSACLALARSLGMKEVGRAHIEAADREAGIK